jgi:hypothetical protein
VQSAKCTLAASSWLTHTVAVATGQKQAAATRRGDATSEPVRFSSNWCRSRPGGACGVVDETHASHQVVPGWLRWGPPQPAAAPAPRGPAPCWLPGAAHCSHPAAHIRACIRSSGGASVCSDARAHLSKRCTQHFIASHYVCMWAWPGPVLPTLMSPFLLSCMSMASNSVGVRLRTSSRQLSMNAFPRSRNFCTVGRWPFAAASKNRRALSSYENDKRRKCARVAGHESRRMLQ